MPNPWEMDWSSPQGGGVQIKAADPKLPGQVRGQELTNAEKSAGLDYVAPKANADLTKTRTDIQGVPMERADTLAKRFEGQDAVKQYRAIAPIFMSGLKAANDSGGDLDLLYAYAKVMDPGSVVRESEQENAKSNVGFWDAKVAELKKQFGDSSGGLSQKTRDFLRRGMNTKAAELAKTYGVQRSDYQKIAQQRGVDPFQVVGSPPLSGQQVEDYKRLMHGSGFTLRDEVVASAGGAGTDGPSKVDPTGGNPLLSEGDRDYLQRNAKTKGRQWVEGYLADRKLELSPEVLDKAYKYWADGGTQDPVVIPPQSDGNIVGQALATAPGTAAASYLNSAAFGVPQLLAGDKPFDAISERNPKSAITGDILGGFTGTLGAGAGLVKAGMSVPAAGLAANLGYGTAFGANTNEDNRLGGAALGLGASAVGEGIGRYALAPAIDAAVRTQPGQKALGMFGRSAPRRMDAPEKSLVNDLIPEAGDIRSTLADAERFGLPMSLADASPTARQTLGAASRLDPTVRTNIGTALENRAGDRNNRALSGLSGLAEPVDMRATKDEIFKAAQEAASPFYERAYAQPAIVTPEVSNLLQRPSLQQAMSKAQGTIAEQGGSPTKLGFALDGANNPVLNPIPTNQLSEMGSAQSALEQAQNALKRGEASLAGNIDRNGLRVQVEAAQARLQAAQQAVSDAPMVGNLAETPAYDWNALDYTKRGLDDVLEDMRDPVTRRLPSDYKTRAVQDTRVNYRDALGRLNDDYRQGLDAYSGIARRNDDLNAGFSAADSSANLSDFTRSLSNVTPDNMDYFQRGYTTNLSDTVKSRRDGSNAYDLIAGTQDQRDKMTRLFPNADDFLRRRELERSMTATNQEVLGGPATAGRLAANERFQGPDIGTAAEIGLSMATGVPPVGAITNGARTAARGMFGRRSQQMTQDAARNIAPTLAEQNPAAAVSSLDKLLADYEALSRYNSGIKTGSALVTAPALAAYSGYRF